MLAVPDLSKSRWTLHHRNPLAASYVCSLILRWMVIALPPFLVLLVTLPNWASDPSLSVSESGRQPQGSLSGKILYIHGGHGYTSTGGPWYSQRPLLLNMVEDLGNKDQMDMFAEYLFRAGATIVPLRPIGYQHHEVVLDNVDSEVTYTGKWADSSGSVYFGKSGEVPYRFSATSAHRIGNRAVSTGLAKDRTLPGICVGFIGGKSS